MKKINLLLLFVGLLTYTQAQVGINTTDPFSTLEVKTEPSGTIADGIIAPNLKLTELIARNALYTSNQSGAFVYVTAIDATPAGKTVNVTTTGYYYYDAPNSVWKHFNDKLQNADNGLSLGTTANVQLGGDLTKNTTIDVKAQKLTINNTGGTDTGLQLSNTASAGHVLTSDANGNATWNAPGFSEFTSIKGVSSSPLDYPATPKTYTPFYTGLSVNFPSAGTYLVTLGILLTGSASRTDLFCVQLMPTNLPTNWTSTTERYEGSYEAFNSPGWDRIYYSQTLTIPADKLTAYLMIASVHTKTAGTVNVYMGEKSQEATPQGTGGSFVRIN